MNAKQKSRETKADRLGYLNKSREALRNGDLRLARYWHSRYLGEGINPEPTDKQLALYARAHSGAKWRDAWFPDWLKAHLRARQMPKPFVPDYTCTTAKCPRGHKIPDGCTITVTQPRPALRKAA